mgnify:CR=1 FL=1
MSEAEEVDEYTARIERTGCADLNEKVLLCFAEHRDWRKCSNEVREFRACYEKYQGKAEVTPQPDHK